MAITLGAIAAMQMAVEAGYPGDEATEWARIQLGHLYENTGDLKSAEMHYTIALEERPGMLLHSQGWDVLQQQKKTLQKPFNITAGRYRGNRLYFKTKQ